MFILPTLNYSQEVLIIWDNSTKYAPRVALKNLRENQGFSVIMSSVNESCGQQVNR